MATNPKLENYLLQLDKCLSQIAISERAEIISEIKSHVEDAMENNPERNMSEILGGFGEPEIAANRYLTERGLKPHKAPKRPILKWLTVGFLGTFGFICLISFRHTWDFRRTVVLLVYLFE